jgi:hypothetical protein
MNVIQRSASPEKPNYEDKAVSQYTRANNCKQKYPVAPARSTKKTNKRRKVEVQRDETAVVTEARAQNATLPSGAVDTGKSVDSPVKVIEASSCSMEPGSADDGTTRLARKRTELRNGNQRSQCERPAELKPANCMRRPAVDAGSEAMSQAFPLNTVEDDIDWLFEPIERMRMPPKRVSKNSAPPARASKTRSKMVDIDLDDLLSNIASFAKAQSSNDVANNSGRLMHAQTKPRTSRRQNVET